MRTTLEPGLDVEIHQHDVGTQGEKLPAWTLVTSGLAAFGQREVVFTILRKGSAREQFPEGVLGYIPALKHFAQQGRTVDDGDVSGYDAPGPFRLGPFVGVAFLNALPMDDVALPKNALRGIFLTEGELAMAGGCSVSRVLHRLGQETRYFPVPYWCDSTRKTVYEVADVGRSVLAQMERAIVPSATATLRGEAMTLKLPRTFAKALADTLSRGDAMAVLPRRDPSVMAALVWSPDSDAPEAIMAEGQAPSEIAATFAAFIPSEDPADAVRFIEDGYAAILSPRSTEHLAGVLRDGSNCLLKSDGRSLAIKIAHLD